MRLISRFLVVLFCVATFAFAAAPADNAPAGNAVAASAAPVDSAPAVASESPVDVMQEELAMRDSVMQVRDSLCTVEKDSLRKAIVVEEAKCANWEQSYQTVKRDNEVCAQALGTTLEINEKNKEKADDERRKAAMSSGMSFTSGLLLGALLFWLIFD